ncbi:DMT family transporter [Secundilactobacillus muriivasis]
MTSAQSHRTWLGVTFAIVSGIAFGLSGVAASTLFRYYPRFDALWLSQVRMVSAGLILLLISGFTRQHPFAIWQHWHSARQVVIYGLFGTIPVQFCYFLAVQAGNASIATILQYLGPFAIVAYYILRYRQLPRRSEVVGMILAFIGVALIVTHGQFQSLSISPAVLFWGLMAALGTATNTLLPRPILPKYGVLNCTGWALLIAGTVLNLAHPMWRQSRPPLTLPIVLLVLAIVLVGTVLALALYNISFSYIQPTTASLLNAFEPLSATLFSVLLLGIPFTGFDATGSLLVIVAVMCLTLDLRKYFRLLRRR